jgi:carboxymethylenebutenolidase
MGSYVDIGAAGGTFSAYVATPELGSGPGVVLLQEIFGVTQFMREAADHLAAEGYVVVVPDLFWRLEPGVELTDQGQDLDHAFELYGRFDIDRAVDDIGDAIEALRALPEHVGKVGVVGFCLGGRLAALVAARSGSGVNCGASYYPVALEDHLDEVAGIDVPFVLHLAGEDAYCSPDAQAKLAAAVDDRPDVSVHVYPGVGHPFANPYRAGYDKPSAQMAYSRTIAVLRTTMGPHRDLGALWDRHMALEFGARDVAGTMATMVEEPYVNSVPTMTGGVGYEMLARFYKYHFVDVNPDQRIIPVSRTVGADRLVDEFVSCFTHDREIPWLLPGVPATGRYVEIPVIAIVCFRGDKIYHEHIYWDHASLLAQVGLIDREKLPVGGAEVARKLLDESLHSNQLMPDWDASETFPVP